MFYHLQELFLIVHDTQNITRPIYDPPSVPSVFKHPNKTIRPKIIILITNKLLVKTMIHLITFFPPSDTNIQPYNIQNVSQSNNNVNSMTQHPYAHLLQTNSSQNNFPPQNQRSSYSNIVQPSQR